MDATRQTERLARAALELHRLATAAAELATLASPSTPMEKNAKGVSDPTASAALCPRRTEVARVLANVHAQTAEIIREVDGCALELTSAIDEWDA